tara:strand:- start:1614 stop:2027 length:414 start_codon:yes stop_codon:yes gene_type:complete
MGFDDNLHIAIFGFNKTVEKYIEEFSNNDIKVPCIYTNEYENTNKYLQTNKITDVGIINEEKIDTAHFCLDVDCILFSVIPNNVNEILKKFDNSNKKTFFINELNINNVNIVYEPDCIIKLVNNNILLPPTPKMILI